MDMLMCICFVPNIVCIKDPSVGHKIYFLDDTTELIQILIEHATIAWDA
jgi:hypothetical protein